MNAGKIIGFAMVAGLACSVYAHTVTCNLVDNGTGYVTTDHVEYTLTVDGSGDVERIGIAYFASVAPLAGTFYLKDSLGQAVAGFSVTSGNDDGFTIHETYVQNGSTVVGYDLFHTGLNVMWTGGNLGVGTYTLGWAVPDATYYYGEVAMYVLGNEFSNDNWNNPVNSGQAPVHGLQVVPEPTSFALLGLGAAILALRRRKV